MQQDNSQAVTILVLGICGLTVCGFCAPVAWVMGNNYVKTCAALGQQPDQMGVIGRILGMVGTLLIVAFLMIYFLMFCAIGVGSMR